MRVTGRLCAGVADKRAHVQQMGLTGLLADVAAQQQRLLEQYHDARAACAALLQVCTA